MAAWAAYTDLEPWGERRADLRAAWAAQGVMWTLGAGKDATPDKWFPTFDETTPAPKRQQTQEEQMGLMEMIGAMGFARRVPPEESSEQPSRA